MSSPTSNGRRVKSLVVPLVCMCAIALGSAGQASAFGMAYNCGNVPPGGYCNATINYWGPVFQAGWTLNNGSALPGGPLPVRINRGNIGPTAWQWVNWWQAAQFPYSPQGVAQVKNTTNKTLGLTVGWN